jgi:shikimate kinase
MMGSGKSTIGRRLAKLTGWSYVDNDDLVRRASGATPRQLLAEQGEGPMRAAESAALRLGLDTPAPSIVGVAAGTILDPANRDQLRDGGTVVWLRADAAALQARAPRAAHRPWVDRGSASWIREATASREPLYASVADITVDTTGGSVEGVADEILERLASTGACRESFPEPRRRASGAD